MNKLDQIIQQTLCPDIEVNFFDTFSAKVHVVEIPLTYIAYGRLIHIAFTIWDHCYRSKQKQVSVIVFDKHKKILCNGVFSFLNLFRDRELYKTAFYNFHLIIEDINSSQIEFFIKMNSIQYNGNFNAHNSDAEKTSNWFEYFCSISLELLKNVCVSSLYAVHKTSLKLFEGHAVTVTIHHFDIHSYTWMHLHRRLKS